MKTFNVFCLVVFVGLIIANFVWKEKQSNRGYETISYNRFHTVDKNGFVSFNWSALISPTQNEARRVELDTIKVTEMIYLPKAKKYILVNPLNGDMGERLFVGKIKRVFADSASRTKIWYGFSLDGQSAGVRKYKIPFGIFGKTKLDSVNLFGTASPEGASYGLTKSLMPGNFEKENLNLAFDRLSRSAQIIEKLGYKANSLKFAELQFPDTASALQAMTDPSILNKMRFVKASAVMPIQKLDIKTLVLPILLPIWLWLSGLVFIFITKNRSPVQTPRTRPPNNLNNWLVKAGILEFLKISFGAILIVILSTAIVIFLGIYYLIGIIIFFLIYLLWLFRSTIRQACKEFTAWVSWDASQVKYWWRSKSSLQKVLYFIGLYALALTAWVLYLWTQ